MTTPLSRSDRAKIIRVMAVMLRWKHQLHGARAHQQTQQAIETLAEMAERQGAVAKLDEVKPNE